MKYLEISVRNAHSGSMANNSVVSVKEESMTKLINILKEKEAYIIKTLLEIGVIIEPNKIDLRKDNYSVILGRDKRKLIIK